MALALLLSVAGIGCISPKGEANRRYLRQVSTDYFSIEQVVMDDGIGSSTRS